MFMNESLLRESFEAVSKDSPVGATLQAIRGRWGREPDNAIIFGGALRSIAMRETPRDIDVVTRAVPTFEGLTGVRTNTMGGNSVRLHGFNVDIWTFADTWGVRFLEMHPYVV